MSDAAEDARGILTDVSAVRVEDMTRLRARDGGRKVAVACGGCDDVYILHFLDQSAKPDRTRTGRALHVKLGGLIETNGWVDARTHEPGFFREGEPVRRVVFFG